ncbi:hypothetical protein IGI37_000706 [Enterococcus sp. AZ194]|uniref:TetR/AcrR family transcriptional regulator n=1 Tax=Enterococcus sp. AZ194 TaxID=2774629 RepID=UPI003F1E6494
MPPKQKFSREEIVASAVKILRQDGLSGITARALAEELGSSPRPIFTVFHTMEEVQDSAIEYAKNLYNGYVSEALEQDLAFKAVGEAYIRFASEEPKMFQLLFMSEKNLENSFVSILSSIDENSQKILQSISESYGFSDEKAYRLYMILWVFTHGIATLYATGVHAFEPTEVGGMMADVFLGAVHQIK